MKRSDYESVVRSIQAANPKLLLCGSLALILADKLDMRDMGDIDFVVNNKDYDNNTHGISWIAPDPDPYNLADDNGGDGYESLHGQFKYNGKFRSRNVDINLLVFDDDIELKSETLTDSRIRVQDLDTVMRWKKKYNRDKDIKDMNNIANKCLEDIIAQ